MTTASEEVWFILLQGEQLGPLSFEDVLDFYYKDVVTGDSLLWREGWSDWVTLIQIPEFNSLLFQGVMLKEPTDYPSNNEEPEEATAFVAHQNFRQLQEAQSIITDDSSLEEIEELDDLVDIDLLENELEEMAAPHLPQIDAAQLNSHAPVIARKIPPKKFNPVGLILLLLLAGIVGYTFMFKPWETPSKNLLKTSSYSEDKDKTINLILSQSVQSEKKPHDPTHTLHGNHDQSGATKTSTNSHVFKSSREESLNKQQSPIDQGLETELALPKSELDQDAQESLKLPTSQINSDTKSPGIEEIELDIETPFTVETNQGSKVQSKNTGSSKKKNSSSSKGKRSQKGTSASRTNKKSKSSKSKSSKIGTGKIKRKPNPSDKNKGRVTLGRGDLINVLKREKSKFSRCLTLDPKLKGTVNVMVVIQRDGKVSSANPTSAKLRKSSANSCVITTVKGLKFPKYTGDLVSVPLPITL